MPSKKKSRSRSPINKRRSSKRIDLISQISRTKIRRSNRKASPRRKSSRKASRKKTRSLSRSKLHLFKVSTHKLVDISALSRKGSRKRSKKSSKKGSNDGFQKVTTRRHRRKKTSRS